MSKVKLSNKESKMSAQGLQQETIDLNGKTY